jgi:hypothetical protein
MPSESKRVRAPGGWTVAIGSEFELRDNRDSLQAVHEERIVYVSSMRVGLPGVHLPAEKLRAAAAARLGAGERLSHIGPSVQGDAEVSPNGDAWRLKGTMCANGSMATCLIDFHAANDRSWAISVWTSLLCDGVYP